MTTADLKSYRPGSWFGIFGEHATVLLPPSEKGRVAALWELVDDGAGFGEVLDALIVDGLRDLPGFVLVSDRDDTTQVVLRGPAKAVFTTADGETSVVDGSAASTWVERSLTGVRSMQVVLEASDADDLTISGGLVRVGQVDEPPFSVEEAAIPADDGTGASVDGAAGADAVGGAGGAGPVGADTEVFAVVWAEAHSEVTAVGFAEAAEPEEPAVEVPEPEVPVVEVPVVEVPVVEVPAVEVPAVEVPAVDEPAVPVWGLGPAAVLPPAPEGEPDEDHDGMTRAGAWEGGQFARQQPGIPGQPPAPSVTARPVACLTFSSGERLDVDRAILVGRAPEARRFSSTDQPRLVTVPSPNQEISSTHLEIRPGSGVDHGSAIVTDMGSTNGTVLVQPGLAPEDLQPGIPVQLIPGAIVDLGDGVRISVSQP